MESYRIECYLNPRDYVQFSISEFRCSYILMECVNHDNSTTIGLDLEKIEKFIEILTIAKNKLTS